MGQRIRRFLARGLALTVAPLGVMAGMAPASAAWSPSHGSGGRTSAGAAALAAVPASLQAAISESLGISVSAAGYSLQAELTSSDRAADGGFGVSVALSAGGTTALVGANNRHSDTGAAYVFTRRGSTWSQTAELTAAHGAAGDDFGWSVALSAGGTTALVGAPLRNKLTGAAYVFTLRGGTWSQTAQLTGSHGDSFGWSVALSGGGTTALIGAQGDDYFAGAAFVFSLRGGTWSRTAKLTAPHRVPFHTFGISVALSAQGSTALVSGEASPGTGAAFVFSLRGGTWSRAVELTAAHQAPGAAFGVSLALSAQGSTALVGSGEAAYVFTRRGGAWSRAVELTAARGTSRTDFGSSVALSAPGTTALVGQPPTSLGGAAYVFTLRGGTWSQAAELTPARGAPGGLFGTSVALSAPGSTVLVGAIIGPAYVFTGGGRI